MSEKMYTYKNSLIAALVPIAIVLFMSVEILFGETTDDLLFAYLGFGNLGLGLFISAAMRFRARGMMWALIFMGIGQLAIAVVALVTDMGTPAVVVAVTGIIAIFFISAAWLFWHVAKKE